MLVALRGLVFRWPVLCLTQPIGGYWQIGWILGGQGSIRRDFGEQFSGGLKSAGPSSRMAGMGPPEVGMAVPQVP